MMKYFLLFQDQLLTTDSFYPIILLLILITPLLVLLRRRNNGKSWRLPSGPSKLPIIGNLHQLGGDLTSRSLLKLSNKHGPLMLLQLGSVPTLVISSTDVAKEICKNHDIVFSGRPALYTTKRICYGCQDITFAPYGDYWREIRKISILELLSPKRVASFRAVKEEEVSIAMDFVRKASASMVPINITEMSFSVVKIEENFQQLDSFYESVIDEHLEPQRPCPEFKDFVDVLLRLQKDPDQRILTSRDQIKALLTDMFSAGTDTSSSTLVWTMTELIKNPTVMESAQEEVRTILGNKDMVEEIDLPKLNYLKSVVKETLRLHAPVPLLVPRETTDNCTINGYEIPAETRVIFNAKAIAMDPKFWDAPEEYRPERFMTKNIDFKGVQDFEMIPFGIGRRSCPAINFALVVIELVLANLLHQFDWEMPLGMKKEEIDMQEAPGITVHKKFPLFLVATTAQM